MPVADCTLGERALVLSSRRVGHSVLPTTWFRGGFSRAKDLSTQVLLDDTRAPDLDIRGLGKSRAISEPLNFFVWQR
jgi:hypothetical protein